MTKTGARGKRDVEPVISSCTSCGERNTCHFDEKKKGFMRKQTTKDNGSGGSG